MNVNLTHLNNSEKIKLRRACRVELAHQCSYNSANRTESGLLLMQLFYTADADFFTLTLADADSIKNLFKK